MRARAGHPAYSQRSQTQFELIRGGTRWSRGLMPRSAGASAPQRVVGPSGQPAAPPLASPPLITPSSPRVLLATAPLLACCIIYSLASDVIILRSTILSYFLRNAQLGSFAEPLLPGTPLMPAVHPFSHHASPKTRSEMDMARSASAKRALCVRPWTSPGSGR